MKKTGVNILCICIIGILAILVLLPVGVSATQFLEGVSHGYDAVGPEQSPMEIALSPDNATLLSPVDSLRTENGQAIPMAVHKAMIYLPEHKVPGWIQTVTIICYFINIALFILLVIDLVKFIVNINKGRIFERLNVKYLRRFGYCLLGIAFFDILAGGASEILINNAAISVAGYSIGADWEIPWYNILIGFVALLMAQTWAIGIKMREEQELTI